MRAVRIAFSPARPSRLKKPPGILPAAYAFSSTSTVSGKKSAPSRPSVRPTAVARTTVPSCFTSTAPCACLATAPVSKLISFSPIVTARRVAPGSTAMLICLLSSLLGPAGLRAILRSGRALAAQAQLLDQRAVALQIVPLHVGQQPAPPADQLEQAAAGMVVVLVHLHVLGELADPLREQGDLHLGGAGVGRGCPEFPDQLRLLFLGERHAHTSLPRSASSPASQGCVGKPRSSAVRPGGRVAEPVNLPGVSLTRGRGVRLRPHEHRSRHRRRRVSGLAPV